MKRSKGYILRQAERLTAGEINRRRFIMSALSAGVTLPTATSLASRAEAHTPRKGGTFRLATRHGVKTDNLDPRTARNGFTRMLQAAQGNRLTEVLPNGALAGELAEVFEARDDARQWNFTLRQGVEFHNGKSLTAEDVIASLNRQRGAQGLLAEVSDIRSDGPFGIAIALQRANPDFGHLLADERLTVLASDKGRFPVEGPSAGTGGYELQLFEPGVRAELTRNPNYWKPGAAHFDAVILQSVSDAARRQTAIMTGDVDYVDGIDPRAVALVRRLPTLEILDVPGDRAYGFVMPLDRAPFDNPEFRAALHLAVPRQELVDRVLLGHGRAVDAQAGMASDGFGPELAARHYRASGHIGKVQLWASESAFPGAFEAARLLATRAAGAGIDIEVLGGAEDPGDCLRVASLSDEEDRNAFVEWIPAMWAHYISAHSKTLTNTGKIATLRENDDHRITERWWFA